jgi:uncharacterized delta-60 repeat protein
MPNTLRSNIFGLVDWLWQKRRRTNQTRRCRIGIEELEARVVPSAGDLNPTFGTGGIAITTMGSPAGRLTDMVLQPDGKILTVGTAHFNTGAATREDFGLARFNGNGTLDTTFGTGGKVFTHVGGRDGIRGVALQSNGMIVTVGNTGFSGDGWAVARYDANGMLDPNFGTGGIVISNLQPGSDGAFDVAIQADGKIVVVGASGPSPSLSTSHFAVVRYNIDGSLDTSFGGVGYVVTTAFGNFSAEAHKVLLQPDGKILALGSSSNSGGNFSFAAARYNHDGSIDTGFGTGGIVKITAFNAFEDTRDAILLPDGKILMGGVVFSNITQSSEIALVRLTSAGQLDLSFGTNGKTFINLGNDEAINGMALQADGKIVAVGGSGQRSWVGRFNPEGTLDLTFGTVDAGIIVTDIDASNTDNFDSVLVMPNGDILAGGWSNEFTLARFQGGSNPGSFPPDVDLVTPFTLGSNASSPANLVDVNGTVFFAANDGINGVELWKSSGDLESTVLVKDILAGTGSSSPANFINLNGTVFFTANDGVNGVELWKSDGTAEGTVLVRDISAGGASSNPTNFTVVGNIVFFTANNTTNGIELWSSDGTTGGTVLVRDIQPVGTNGSNPANLVNVNGTLFFTASNASGNELWKSDGSTAGTVMVRDIIAGSGSANPTNLRNVNGTLFFSATNNINGVELWKSDGTLAGTVLVKDLVVGSGTSNPANFAVVGNTLYFTATVSPNGNELWKSDGTAAGTVLVADISSGAGSSTPSRLTDVNGVLYFVATTPANGIELWKSNGTSAGTILVKDIVVGSVGSGPSNLVALGNTVYFAATTATNGTEIWASDGTTAGTVLLRDINPGTASSNPAFLTAVGETLFVFFSASDPVNGSELWRTDGTAAGTVMVKNINAIPSDTSLTPLSVASGSWLYFRARDAETGLELWKTDGTAAGTTQVKDIFTGTTGSNLSRFTDVNGILFFTATDGVSGVELWRSDGTAIGTFRVKDLLPGSGDSNPSNLTNVNGVLYFTANDGVNGVELWKSDGSAAGTTLVKDIRTGAASANPASLVNVSGTLYFTADDGINGTELWSSDGSFAGTTLVRDIRPGVNGSSPVNLTNVSGILYFAANDGTTGTELWKSNGTSAGTLLVQDIRPSNSSSNPANLTALGNTLYFAADNGINGTELWKSSGTSAGTTLVRDIRPGFQSSSPLNLTASGGKLFFAASGANDNAELWASDGTAAGTVLLRNIAPGSAGSNPSSLTNVNGRLYFSADHPGLGAELWTSDGTSSGTVPVKDLFGGSMGSSPNNLVFFQNHLYFTANDDVHAMSIWRVNFRPTAVADSFTASEDTLLTVGGPGVVANDVDGDGDSLTVQLISGATYGFVSLNTDGSFTYQAQENYSGPDAFSYQANDGTAISNIVTVSITVNAIADAPSLSVTNASGSEGSPVPMNISTTLVDQDGSESLSITISGVPANVTLSAGTNHGDGSWTLTPGQLTGLTLSAPDDAAFVLTVEATATEGSNSSTATSTAFLSVVINNVAPIITSLTSTATTLGGVLQGQTVSIAGTFIDAGVLDTHTALIHWGDGTTTTGLVSESGGSGSLAGDHVYAFGGIYTITVTLTDKDAGIGTETTSATVSGAGIQNGVLYVIGTTQADHVQINQIDGTALRVDADFISTTSWMSFNLADVQKIIVLLGSGDDFATVGGNVGFPLLIDGSDGNDSLSAGAGSAILLGGQGNDLLVGSGSRDLLIGGSGADQIVGIGNDDVLIGGTTAWDANPDALFQQLAEWNRPDLNYAERIDHLRDGGGLNGTYLLDEETVLHDASVDVLIGSSGMDWFWANLDASAFPVDLINGQNGTEVLN